MLLLLGLERHHLFLSHLLAFPIVNALVVLLLLIVHSWLLAVLLSLEHRQLLLLLLVEHVHATLRYRRHIGSGEVSQLIQLVEVLSSLKQDLLRVSHVVVGVQIGVAEDSYVLLKVSDLVVGTDELLSLLLNQKGSICHIELHDGFLLIINVFEVFHLVFGSLDTVHSLSFELGGVAG